MCAVLAAGACLAADSATALQRSLYPPHWAGRPGVCAKVDFTRTIASGRSGPLAGGYNVYWLVIVRRKGLSCKHARSLARRDWIHGHQRPLHWRLRRSWATTSGGSAWVGDYVGRGGGRVVEYLAVH